MLEEESPLEGKALRNATLAGLAFVLLLVVSIAWPNSPMRNEDGGLIPSTFLSGIIPITLLFFIIIGVAYGV
ncbi:AbgT family transporter, partial [Planococcus sp. SIMBA_143]